MCSACPGRSIDNFYLLQQLLPRQLGLLSNRLGLYRGSWRRNSSNMKNSWWFNNVGIVNNWFWIREYERMVWCFFW